MRVEVKGKNKECGDWVDVWKIRMQRRREVR